MIGESFSVFNAIERIATGLLGNTLDAISSIPNLIFLIALLAIVMIFGLLILIFGGKIKCIIQRYL